MPSKSKRQVASILLLASFFGGCGGGGEDTPSTSPQTDPNPPSGNSAPTIQGQPATSAVVGQSYSFQPVASDPNGDSLTFSASNLPSWISINASTGRLSGTPDAGAVGSYPRITVTVSDGRASASLASFDLTVAAVGTGSATLSWSPPTQNSDGTALTNLASYTIMYGRSADDLAHSVSVTNPSISTYVVENLATGSWYFAVVAVNTVGISSQLSNVATKTIS